MVITLTDSSSSQLRTVTGLTHSNPRPGLHSAAAHQDTIKWFEARWRRTEHCSSASTVSFPYHVLFTTLFCANTCESFPPACVQLLHYSRSDVIRVRTDKMSLTPAREQAIIRVRVTLADESEGLTVYLPPSRQSGCNKLNKVRYFLRSLDSQLRVAPRIFQFFSLLN